MEKKDNPNEHTGIKLPATPASGVPGLPGSTADDAILVDSPPSGEQTSRNQTSNIVGPRLTQPASRRPGYFRPRSPPKLQVVFVKKDPAANSKDTSSAPILVDLGTVRRGFAQYSPRPDPIAPSIVVSGVTTQTGQPLSNYRAPRSPVPSSRPSVLLAVSLRTTANPVSLVRPSIAPSTTRHSTSITARIGAINGRHLKCRIPFQCVNQFRSPFSRIVSVSVSHC